MGAEVIQLLTVQNNVAARVGMATGDGLKKRGFAHAVCAHDGCDLALFGGKGNAVQDLALTVVQCQIANVEHGLSSQVNVDDVFICGHVFKAAFRQN